MTALPNFDIWDQALLTDIVNKPFPGSDGVGVLGDALGSKIAPLKSHAGRLAKIRIQESVAGTMGQFRAPDATPPLMAFKGYDYREEVIELALLDEMHRIMEEDWMKLNSSDENISRSAGKNIIERAQELRLRNEKLTEWMRWQAFRGELTIEYPHHNSSLYINYGLPAGHKVTLGTPWTDPTSDPIADVEAWNEVLSDDVGFGARFVHMTSRTYRLLVDNETIRDAINFNAPSANTVLRPRLEDIKNLFNVFSQNVELVIYDDGFRDEDASGYGYSSLTRYLPDYEVLVTTDYVLPGGQRIADTLDGLVTVSSGYNTVSIRPGAQAEVMLDHLSKTHFMRYASARIPRLLVPEAFLWATVGEAE